MEDKNQLPNEPPTRDMARRPYQRPELFAYGSVAKLTQSGSGPGLEGMSGKAGMV